MGCQPGLGSPNVVGSNPSFGNILYRFLDTRQHFLIFNSKIRSFIQFRISWILFSQILVFFQIDWNRSLFFEIFQFRKKIDFTKGKIIRNLCKKLFIIVNIWTCLQHFVIRFFFVNPVFPGPKNKNFSNFFLLQRTAYCFVISTFRECPKAQLVLNLLDVETHISLKSDHLSSIGSRSLVEDYSFL